MTVEELITLLKKYNKKDTLFYTLKDNNKVKISDIVIHEHHQYNEHGITFYLKIQGTKNGRIINENI